MGIGLNDEQRVHFHHLWDRETCGEDLTEAEQTELAEYLRLMDAAESAYLAPVTQQLREERLVVEARNQELQALVEKEERLAERLKSFLREIETERHVIRQEWERLMVATPASKTALEN